MKKNTNIYFLVGLFVCIGFLGLLILAFRVGGLAFTSQRSYEIHAIFSDVSGLTTRADVSIAGVNVGRVLDIDLEDDAQRAKVIMAINENIQLPIDTSASIRTSGLLGSKYVGLYVGADEEILAPGDTIFDTQSSLQLEDLIGKFLVQ